MFGWFRKLVHAWSHPQAMSDEVFTLTINQLRACRAQVALLIEEARLAKQFLDITDAELRAARRSAKRELDEDAEHARQGIRDLLANDATMALTDALERNRDELEAQASVRQELSALAQVMEETPPSWREAKARSDTPALQPQTFTAERRQR